MSNQTVIVAAERWLTYPSDVRYMLDVAGTGVGETVGPDIDGEVWEAVEATYDPAADKTRVGFASVLVTDRARRIQNEEKESIQND